MFSFRTHTVSPACLCFDQNIPSHSFFKTRPYVMSVCWLQLVKGYTIVQDGFDAGLFRNKLDNPLAEYFLTYEISHLRFKCDLAHGVIEATNFEFASLERKQILNVINLALGAIL